MTTQTEALAQTQEPVAWTVAGQVRDWSKDFSAYKTQHYVRPVYTTPPQRKPLTDEQLIDLWPSLIMHQHTYAFARAIEAAHNIKE